MIIFMSDILCVTNRSLCQEDFLERIEKIAACHPAGIILREKDLSEEEYKELAEKVIEICARFGTNCILHSFVNVARELRCSALHLPLPVLRALAQEKRIDLLTSDISYNFEKGQTEFKILGASCHSVEEAIEAESLGCTYITAGHIFDTDCKKGLPGRGLTFLKEVCENVSIPVYAIGGINPENIAEIRLAHAAGACIMSSAMKCANVQEYLSAF